MAFCKSAVVATFFILMALCGVSMGDVYKVGDSAGWTTVDHIDYMKWAATKTFKVGDTIVFVYNTQYHNVLEVTRSSFKSCNATSPMATYKSGNDSITIKRPGHFFYMCGLPGHCQAGQKVDIRVPVTPSSLPSLTPAEAPHGSSPASRSSAPSPGPSSSSAPSIHSSMGLYAIQLVLSMVVLAVCFNGFA